MRSKSIVFFPPDSVEIRDISLPEMLPHQVLIETLYSAVSPGTEGRCLKGMQSGIGMHPCCPGYQAVGRVVDAGCTSGYQTGDCLFHYGAEPTPDPLSSFLGAHSKWVIVDSRRALKLSPDAPLASLSMAKLCAVSLHGVELAKVGERDRVAVIGLGLLGQLSARMARLKGARVVAVDSNPQRVESATMEGIEAVVMEDSLFKSINSSEEGFDVIIDVTGVASVLNDGFELGRKLMPWESPKFRGSRYVIQGSYAGDFKLNYDQLFFKEMSVLVPRDHTRADLNASLALIGEGRIDLCPLFGEPVSPMKAPDVYAELADPTKSRRLTAVFDWTVL